MSDKLNTLNALRMASLRSKGYTAEQIASLVETIQGIIDDIDQSLETCEAHVQSQHAPANAEENVIEGIKKNGVVIAPVGKVVDIAVPVKTSDLQNDSQFATTSDVSAAVSSSGHLKSEVVEQVPSASEAQPDTIYYVRTNDGSGNKYTEYRLISGAVVPIGSSDADLSGYATKEYVAKADSQLITELFNTLTVTAEKYVGTGNLNTFWGLLKPSIASLNSSVSDVSSRIDLLELFVTNGEIEGNPFSVTFENLTGVSVTGVWNQAGSRIEF